MTDNNEADRSKAISRRDALKKGAIIGGAALWVAPMVQTIGMSAASAQTTSGQSRHGQASEGVSNGARMPDTHTNLAVTGFDAQHAAELGLAAAALGVGLAAASRVKSHPALAQDDGPPVADSES